MKQKDNKKKDNKSAELMNLMNKPEDMRLKTIKKYGVPFGKITGSEELSSEMKAQLVDKLIKKADKHIDKIDKSLDRYYKIDDLLEDVSEFAFPIGLAATGAGFVLASLAICAGNDGLINPDLAQRISECLKVGGAGAFVAGLGTSIARIPSTMINEISHDKNYDEFITLKEIRRSLNDSKNLLLKESGKSIESEKEV